MPRYTIDSQASTLIVTARSRVHDTDTSWRGITGTIDADLENLEEIGADVVVDMKTADAGDWLKNRKLRKDMDFDSHPEATMKIDKLEDVKRDGNKVSATVHGTLKWRNRELAVVMAGTGKIGDTELKAQGSFEIDVTQLGITPPKVLMIKVEDVVSCKVSVVARSS